MEKHPFAPVINVVPGHGLSMRFAWSLAFLFWNFFCWRRRNIPSHCPIIALSLSLSLDINYLSKHVSKPIKAISHSQSTSYINMAVISYTASCLLPIHSRFQYTRVISPKWKSIKSLNLNNTDYKSINK